MKREPNITEQQAREIVEKMGRRESYTPTTYLQVPKIINRKPVFVSETVRDELDRVVRYLGGKGMSASGLIENLVRLHLDAYRDDIEQWRKL